MKKSILFLAFIGLFVFASKAQSSEPVLSFAGKKLGETVTLKELGNCANLIFKSENDKWLIVSAYVNIWAKDGTINEKQIKFPEGKTSIAFEKELCDLAAASGKDNKVYFDSIKLKNAVDGSFKTVTFYVLVKE